LYGSDLGIIRRLVMRFRRVGILLLCVFTLCLFAARAPAGIVSYTDIDEFRAAAGPLVEIDFTILPNGSPAPVNVPFDVTPEFNYTDWGVTFSSPVPDLRMLSSGEEGGTLSAVSHKSGIRSWIEAEFAPPVLAVGVTTRSPFFVYDMNGVLLAQATSPGFIGFTSDIPIALGVIDRNSNGANITSILFHPIPEPVTLLLLGAGALVVVARRR
jgi:hypothetical protein